MTTSEIQSQITQAALQYGIPPSVALAVAKTENPSFNPNATNLNKNGTTDYGIMQINSSNLSAWGVTNPLDPSQNINAGVSFLAKLYQQYGGDVALTAAAYNAGQGAVASGRIPPSTQSYVASVLSNQGQFSSTVPSDYTSTDSGVDVAVSPGFDLSQVNVAGLTVSTPVLLGSVGLGLWLLWKIFGD